MTREDGSLYDSGRTDSGFLSGANILSGEITPPPEPQPQPRPGPEDRPRDEGLKCQDPGLMRLDSGVDVGLSDQLSELAIEEPGTPDHPCKSTQPPPPWELYFQQDEEGDTQLHIAIIQGFIEVVYSLIRMVPHPRYLDICNDMRQTGCHLAVLTSQPRILRRLVCVGARTDCVDRNGNTPLHLATIAGDLACVRALTDPIADAEVIAAGLTYTPRQRPVRPSELDMYNYEGKLFL
ncbi:hypothetical protein AAG570_003360 [Ranatra chinensis]|uniref:Uncharacterized protein n=1 Tax=Ranatra chinensis TaxID=642074 RepID=A0ABD0Y3Q7_9HEMI